jgi:folate-binding protein YgfZ
MSLFAAILVSGLDARSYLQGQLTCDIDKLTRDNSLLACCNSAQGRVQAVMTVIERDEGIVLSVVASMAELTIQRLRKYVLRAKVKIEATHIPALLSTDSDATLLAQLRAGIPHVFPETHEAFVAQMLNLDVLGGISFEKGCYTGQEIIARAHFRGAVKRRMHRYSANCPPPTPGERLLVDQQHVGDVVYAVATEQGCELLAVVSITHAKATLVLNESDSLTQLTLPYALA